MPLHASAGEAARDSRKSCGSETKDTGCRTCAATLVCATPAADISYFAMFGCLRGLCRPHCSNLSVTIRATPCLLRLQRQQQLLNTYLLHTCNNYGEYRASLAVEAAARRITPEPSSQLALEQGSASMSSTLQPQSKMASLLVLTKEEVDMAQKATDGWLKGTVRAAEPATVKAAAPAAPVVAASHDSVVTGNSYCSCGTRH